MLKLVGGVLVGLVVGVGTMLIVWLIGLKIYPTGEFHPRNYAAVGATMANMSTGAFLFVVGSWFLGALAGATVAYRIAARKGAAWLIGMLIGVISVANAFYYPHPVWMQIAAVVAPLLGAWLGSRMTPAQEPAALRTDAP